MLGTAAGDVPGTAVAGEAGAVPGDAPAGAAPGGAPAGAVPGAAPVGNAPGDVCPAVALTLTEGGPVLLPVMFTDTVPGGGGGF